MHLAEDPDSTLLLEEIFGGVSKEARRAQLDNKATRTASQWKDLADEYFNNPDWVPENTQEDERVSSINPKLPPDESYPNAKSRYDAPARKQRVNASRMAISIIPPEPFIPCFIDFSVILYDGVIFCNKSLKSSRQRRYINLNSDSDNKFIL